MFLTTVRLGEVPREWMLMEKRTLRGLGASQVSWCSNSGQKRAQQRRLRSNQRG